MAALGTVIDRLGLERRDRTPRHSRKTVAGQAALASYASLVPFVAAVLRDTGDTHIDPLSTAARHLMQTARRFPNPEAAAGDRFASGAERDTAPLALLDRVDALVALYGLIPVARANAFISNAHGLLGRVLRDAPMIEGLLRTTSDPLVRRSAVVALGLLGVLPSLELAVPDPSDASDTRAFCLAVVLTSGALENATITAALDAADRRAVGAAREVASIAAMRLEAGALIRVVG